MLGGAICEMESVFIGSCCPVAPNGIASAHEMSAVELVIAVKFRTGLEILVDPRARTILASTPKL